MEQSHARIKCLNNPPGTGRDQNIYMSLAEQWGEKKKRNHTHEKKTHPVTLHVAEIGTELGLQPPGAGTLLPQSNNFQIHQFIHLCHSMRVVFPGEAHK